ncbi:type II toxin-antitoxin system RelE/ParE family toxin [Nannocystis bainbridge]|uniref:Type II toxin-antitoxin system RelE/ParE family toxin n=1 Tax=Nannocystis bainbridge TaxID=2995303 RepID=A0ABT5DTB2_9BACT|nr:type II toxin-antitoxin system RelE/ParE family toxin [Nannocystis bainbridge]MDC0716873.1 type II toxin-antitoxin system RelE/ParE family toxin [Nannocystis bainbridge]
MQDPEVVVRLSHRAAHDLDRAVDYYLSQRPGLAQRLLAAVGDEIQEIRRAPARWAVWRTPDLRRILVAGFPYVLVYRITSPGQVLVLAILHQHQDPRRRFPP